MIPLKLIAVIVVSIVAVAAVVVVTGSFPGLNLNQLQDQTENTPPEYEKVFTEKEIYNLLCLGSGKTLDYSQSIDFIRGLNIKVYGTNEMTPSEAEEYYYSLYSDKTLIDERSSSSMGITASVFGWQGSSANKVWGLILASGMTVKSIYGYDLLIITLDGTKATINAFYLFVNLS